MHKRNRYFLYVWHYYAIYAVLIIFFWLLLFKFLATPQKDERLNIFIAAYQVETVLLEQTLHKRLQQYDVKTVGVDYMAPDNGNFNYVFMTRGLIGTDIIILNKEKLPGADYGRYFAAIDPDLLMPYLPASASLRYLRENDNIYGITVYDPVAATGYLTEYIEYTKEDVLPEEYYLFFNKSSLNLGALDNQVSDKALMALRVILGGETDV